MSDPSVELNNEVITATTARAEELFDELVDILAKETDPVGVACSLLIQLTRFIADTGTIAKELAREAARHTTNQTVDGHA